MANTIGTTPSNQTIQRFTQAVNRAADWLIAHWLLALIALFGLWNLLPWLTPLFMQIGWEAPGRAIHSVYVLFCHQMPQRSWFLFGPEFTYGKDQILLAMHGNTDAVIPLTMRSFMGNADMGWKVAWTDRMISFYGGWFVVALAYGLLRRQWRGLSWRWAILLLLPLALDGGSHMFSDLGGLREGFRETNAWLATLTGHAFAPDFYAGDHWGSFNSIMRLATGALGAIGLMGWALPYIDQAIGRTQRIG